MSAFGTNSSMSIVRVDSRAMFSSSFFDFWHDRHFGLKFPDRRVAWAARMSAIGILALSATDVA